MPEYGPGTKPKRPETEEERLERWRRDDVAQAKAEWLEQIGATLAEFDRATGYAHHCRNRITVVQIGEIMGWRGLLSLEQAKLTHEIYRAVNTRSPDPFEGIVPDRAEDEFMAFTDALGIRVRR